MIDIVNCNVYKGQGVLSTELTEDCRYHNRFYHLNLFFFMSMDFQEGFFYALIIREAQII